LRKKLRIKLRPIGSSILGIAVLAGFVYIIGWSSLVTIQSIDIQGTNQKSLITAQLIAGESNLVLNEPLARINPKHEENLIKDLPWVKSVKLSRNWWTRHVTISVTPRIPIAIFSIASAAATAEPRYLASDGSEFTSPQKFTNLATISLIGRDGQARVQRRIVARFVSNLPADLIAGLKNLEITSKGEVIMATDLRKPTLRINWGSGNSSEEIVVKSNVLKGLLNLPENKKITYADLTVASAPIVK